LRMLSAEEERQVVTQWNETEAEYPREACIHELFAEQAQQRPDAVAVIDAAGQISYGELNQRANQVANHLQALGVGPEVVVGICVERSVTMVVGLLGILKAGGAYLPLDAEYPRERLEYMVADAGVTVLLTQRELRARLPQQMSAAVVYLDSEELWAGSSAEPSSRALPLKSSTPLDTVSTTCGSGWVRSCAATEILNTDVKAAHPPATAGGTDCVQQRILTFEAKPSATHSSPSTQRISCLTPQPCAGHKSEDASTGTARDSRATIGDG